MNPNDSSTLSTKNEQLSESSNCGAPIVVDFYFHATEARSDYDCPEGFSCINGYCQPILSSEYEFYITNHKMNHITFHGVKFDDDVKLEGAYFEEAVDAIKTELAIEMLSDNVVSTEEKEGLFVYATKKKTGIISRYQLSIGQRGYNSLEVLISPELGGSQITISRV